jgi:hypothetical protein
MNVFELSPVDGRKSFYGKAKVTERDDGAAVLKSYDTDVCSVDADGTFHRFWSGESATTMRHVKAFLDYYSISGGGVSWWRNQPVERFDWIAFFIGKPVKAGEQAA